MNYKIKLNVVLKTIFFITFFSGFLGSAFLSIQISENLSLFPFRIMMLLLVFVLFLILFKNCNLGNIQGIRIYIIFLLCWFFYAVLTGLWVKSYPEYFKTIAFLIINIGFVLISLLINLNINDFKKLYNIWIMALVISIGVGLWSQITGNYLIEYQTLDDIKGYTIFPVPQSFYYNQNDYASFIALSIPFVFSMFVNQASLKMKIFSILLIILSLFQIITTFSRTNVIAILFMFCFYSLVISKNKFKMCVVIVMIVATSIYAIHQIVSVDNLDKITRQLSVSTGEEVDESSAIRANLIRNGFEYLIGSRGFGIGAGNTEYYMQTYKIYDTGGVINMHNWLMQIFVEYGIIIFTLYLLFWFFIVRNVYRIFNYSQKIKDVVNTKISLALLLSLILFILVSNSSSNYINVIPQWLLFSFSLSYIKYHNYHGVFCNAYSDYPV